MGELPSVSPGLAEVMLPPTVILWEHHSPLQAMSSIIEVLLKQDSVYILIASSPPRADSRRRLHKPKECIIYLCIVASNRTTRPPRWNGVWMGCWTRRNKWNDKFQYLTSHSRRKLIICSRIRIAALNQGIIPLYHWNNGCMVTSRWGSLLTLAIFPPSSIFRWKFSFKKTEIDVASRDITDVDCLPSFDVGQHRQPTAMLAPFFLLHANVGPTICAAGESI